MLNSGMLGTYLLYSFLAAAAVGVAVVAGVVWKALTMKKAPDYDVEKYFWDPKTGGLGEFPSVDDKASKTLTVVVPAYNEEKRIDKMMTEMIDFLEAEEKAVRGFTWEIIVVDDGSAKDQTAAYVNRNYVKKHGSDKFRVLRLARNNGKGGAVRKGMVRARGEYVLMADADGATRASDLRTVLARLREVERDGYGIAVGSRAHQEESDVKATRTPLRRLLMWGFHTFITLMIGRIDIKDTQCGFKLFTRKTAAALFYVQHIDRWAFDVELLYLAAHNKPKVPIVEVPVEWHEVDGSKVDVVADTLKMAKDIFAIRLCYMLGAWSPAREPVRYLPWGKGDFAAHVVPPAK